MKEKERNKDQAILSVKMSVQELLEIYNHIDCLEDVVRYLQEDERTKLEEITAKLDIDIGFRPKNITNLGDEIEGYIADGCKDDQGITFNLINNWGLKKGG